MAVKGRDSVRSCFFQLLTKQLREQLGRDAAFRMEMNNGGRAFQFKLGTPRGGVVPGTLHSGTPRQGGFAVAPPAGERKNVWGGNRGRTPLCHFDAGGGWRALVHEMGAPAASRHLQRRSPALLLPPPPLPPP